jgi:plastocyanin
MHTLAVQLAPVLAAEKSKVPFYIAGGLVVVWALGISLLVGIRKPDVPRDSHGQWAISIVTIVLVLGATSTAVITAGSPAKSEAATAPATSGTNTAAAPTPAAPANTAPAPSTAPASTTPAPSTVAKPAATTLALAANTGGQLAYNTKQLSAKAGAVTIDFANASPIEHNVTIAQAGTVLGATPTFIGGSKPLTLTLKPGTYTFYCSVPGHRQAGMEGTLKVS